MLCYTYLLVILYYTRIYYIVFHCVLDTIVYYSTVCYLLCVYIYICIYTYNSVCVRCYTFYHVILLNPKDVVLMPPKAAPAPRNDHRRASLAALGGLKVQVV